MISISFQIEAARKHKKVPAESLIEQTVRPSEELDARPSRPPDYKAESRALVALSREMATSPSNILQKLAETALDLCHAHSAGRSCDDSTQRCDSQAGWDFRKGQDLARHSFRLDKLGVDDPRDNQGEGASLTLLPT